jgi:hypothetical protein
MRLSHDGLTLWYGTEDAPAPEDVEVGRSGVAVTVGVSPANPSNAVSIQYRVDGGPLRTLPARLVRTDYPRATQYFRATFPDFWSGERVAYSPLLTSAGRRVPGPGADALGSSFRLGGPPPSRETARQATSSEQGDRLREVLSRDRLPFELEYLAGIAVPLRGPELIGVTPEGIKVNWFWYPDEGIVAGPKLNARVRTVGGDWMTIRRDGVGVMDVRATLETAEGALIYVAYPGYFELGDSGYENFLNQKWPDRASTRTTPRFYTAHPAYQWLNRLQGLGVGEVRMTELVYTYDIYVVR